MTSTSPHVPIDGLLQEKPIQTLNEQRYMLPSTNEEIDRLNTQHYLIRQGSFRNDNNNCSFPADE
ncbi:hypothetical protein BC937DRAFT_93746 [Endogone sp. FLAS-F59071]|nr:hypothetical protein BC937DRAFT_93746 [Endogone sp. FLAS-F59071]|eukprot:RUS21061.1 hypothetical protein BC937DRAFT_93746 [Endogone sp. FLAS-F59071]